MTYAKLKKQSPEAFRRYSGVQPETFEAIPALQGTLLEVLLEVETNKKKSSRPNKLALEDQPLLTLTYWREYRTQFHTRYAGHFVALSTGFTRQPLHALLARSRTP